MSNKDVGIHYIYFPGFRKIVCFLLGHRFVAIEQPLELKKYEIDERVCSRCGRAEATIALGDSNAQN